jgi:hypothetical protein
VGAALLHGELGVEGPVEAVDQMIQPPSIRVPKGCTLVLDDDQAGEGPIPAGSWYWSDFEGWVAAGCRYFHPNPTKNIPMFYAVPKAKMKGLVPFRPAKLSAEDRTVHRWMKRHGLQCSFDVAKKAFQDAVKQAAK